MKILFAHRYFPTQMRHLAAALAADPANEVVAIRHPAGGDPLHTELPAGGRIRTFSYGKHLPARRFSIPRIANAVVPDLCVGFAIHETMKDLAREEGFRPDLICTNTLWGEGLFLRDLFPEARILAILEMYFDGREMDFGRPEAAPALPVLAHNATIALSLTRMDHGLTPLRWQRDLFPAEFRPRISVIHEGVDTAAAAPGRDAFTLPGTGVTLTRADEVVTFTPRRLEAMRGADSFVRAVPDILRRRPNAHVVIVSRPVASDPLHPLPAGETVLTRLRQVLGPELSDSRLHAIDRLSQRDLFRLFRIASAHVYLTHPFILSWSILEAMACGCVVIGSDNPPVTEVIEHDRNGLLADLFDPAAIAEAVVSVLAAPDRRADLAAAGRRTVVERYDLHTVCLPAQRALIDRLMAGDLAAGAEAAPSA